MIEIYGIPEDVYSCYGCAGARKLLDDLGIAYKFHPVVKRVDTPLGFDYNREKIVELKERAGFNSMKITYPQIFIDNKHIGGYKDLKNVFDAD